MRGLVDIGWTALLAPVLAAPFVPDNRVIPAWDPSVVASFAGTYETPATPPRVNTLSADWSTQDRVSAHVQVELPRKSPDATITTVGFQLDVLPSEATCGRGNVTVGGVALPQTRYGDDVSTGKGAVVATTQSTVVGSWAFHCVRVNGVPDAQFMKFVIHSVAGEDVEENIGFSLLFRQAGLREIVALETDLSRPDELVANPNPRTLHRADAADRSATAADLADLEDLRSHLRDITYLIREKEHALTQRRFGPSAGRFTDCDRLGCVWDAWAQRAQDAAHTLYRTMSGGDAMHELRRHHPTRPWGRHGNRAGPRPWEAGNGPYGRPHAVCTYPPRPRPRPPHAHHGPPPYHARPSPDLPLDGDPPPPPPPTRHHERPPPDCIPPPHDEPFYHGPSPHHPGGDRAPPPPASDFYRHPHPPPLAPGHSPGTRHRRTLASGVFLVALLSVALHSWARTPARPTARQEERRRRRRAAPQHIIPRLLARTASSYADVEPADGEEKARGPEAEEGRSAAGSRRHDSAMGPPGDLGGAELPADGDMAGSDEGGVVADGFGARSSTRDTPAPSDAGRGRDLLGADPTSGAFGGQ